MPVTESDVGITERLSSHTPFRAVLKQSIDDFTVNEIASDNTVVALTRLPQSTPKRPRPAPSPSPQPPSETSVTPIDAFFPKLHPPPSVALAAALAAAHTSHVLPPQSEKSDRRQVHEWIRDNLPAFATDTVQTDQGQAVRLRLRPDGRPRKRRRVDDTKHPARPADADNPDRFDPREYRQHDPSRFPNKALVNFVLWKRNRDTTEALTMLANALYRNIKHFSYAGTKDRRAVTTQLVQIRGVQPSQLAQANLKLLRRDNNRPSVLVGNPTVAGTGRTSTLRLGDLKGNRFTLVLRDLEERGDNDVENALHSIRTVGFINYFGLQRFGSGVSPTHVTGFAVLRTDFEDVCRRILMPLRIGTNVEEMRPERQRFVLALEKFATKQISATQLLPQLAPWQRIERAIVASFADDENKGLSVYDYRKAFGKLPRFLRMMYGHAVQSFLWNIMASERIRLCRPRPETNNMHAIAGDLVLENSVQDAELSFKTKVRQVTKAEEEKKSVPVHEVFIPVVGSEVLLPDAKYAEPARKILQEENIDLQSQSKSEYALKGTYRRLLALPKNVETKLSSYNDVHEQMAPSSIAKLVAELQASTRDLDATAPTRRVETKAKEDDKECVMKDDPRAEKSKKDRDGDKEQVAEDKMRTDESRKEQEGDKEHVLEEKLMIEMSKTQNDGEQSVRRNEQRPVVTISATPAVSDQNDARKAASEANSLGDEHAIGHRKHQSDDPLAPGPASVAKISENLTAGKASEEKPTTRSTQEVVSDDANRHVDANRTMKENEAIKNTSSVAKDAAVAKADTTVEEKPADRTTEDKACEQTNEASTTDKKSNATSTAALEAERILQAKSTSERNVSSQREEVPNDQVEGANGHNVLEEAGAESDTKVADDTRVKQEPSDDAKCLKNGSGNKEAPRNEQGGNQQTKKALVLSFNLGCAEYATMLVRELTGHESSTAAQKALQEKALQA